MPTLRGEIVELSTPETWRRQVSGEVAASFYGAVIANAKIGPDGSFVLTLPDDVRGKVRVHSDVPDAAPIDVDVTADELIEVSILVNRSSNC